MRNPAVTAEMVEKTSVATTRFLFPDRPPLSAIPPEIKKKPEVQIPVKKWEPKTALIEQNLV